MNANQPVCALAAIMLLAGCGGSYRMGDPLKADAKAKAPQATSKSTEDARNSSPNYRSDSAQRKADQWELKWQQIQASGDKVGWVDHFNVCGLKYRFRNYDQLLHCLDLLDAKIAAGGGRVEKVELVRRGVPVMTGYLRASAYAELGEPETALKWAESARAALPDSFRSGNTIWTKRNLFGDPVTAKDEAGVWYVGAMLGSGGSGLDDSTSETIMMHEGRNNPAALDLRPWMVAMSLAVQRALLYQRLGDVDRVTVALDDLKHWENMRWPGGLGLVPSKIRPFKGKAQLLSIGPLFAQGRYDQVVFYYEALAQKITSHRQRETLENAVNGAFISGALMRAFAPGDARLFTVAIEDVSNALLYAQSLSRLGKVDQARAMLDTLLALPEIPAMGNLYWATLYERGLVAFGQGRHEDGVHLLIRSVEAIESVRSTISFEAAKIGFAGDKQAVYASLIGALAANGDWQRAFLYAERAKARALVDLLAQRRDLGPPPSVDAQVRELFARASTVDSSIGSAGDEESVRGIKVVADARDSLSHAAPEAASLVGVQKVDIPDLFTRLGSDETLVDYYSQGDDLFAFVLHDKSIKGFKLSAKGLDETIRSFRAAIERRDRRTNEISRELYARLIRPLLADLEGKKLTIAPHGALHYLPFAALMDGDDYLLNRYSLRLIPSADTLIYLKGNPPPKVGKLLALGNPELGSRALDLPNAELEARKVAAMFPDSRALLRGEASKSAVVRLGNGFSILHFATHGRFDATAPLNSGLYLAKGSDADGILTAGDLYSLRWDVDLVTLSACETGVGKIANGDDVIGLTRGFLYAGARSIVASLWEVDDAATAQLMVSFYKNLQKNDKRESLRLAQIETRQQFPEPWFWAAFNIVGRAD
ncbi:MAG TPA: CHAT domain-containing protein [Steroidobacteraceae bacterium]|jgi:CHAT domain-containing protein